MRKLFALALAAGLMAGTAWAQSGGGGSAGGGSSAVGGSGRVGSGAGTGNERTLGSQSGPLDTPRGTTPGTRCPPGQSASVSGGCIPSADPSSRRTLPSDMGR